MKKKLILTIAAIAAIAIGVVGMSAYEAHVINVTAHIENALTVPVEANGISFGTVFPEEVALQNLDIQLSSSFIATDRVDDVEYIIRQKPKCGVPVPSTDPIEYSSYPQVTEGPGGTFVCPPGSVMLPLLCPYLSKHEVGGTGGIEAFHGPLTGWAMSDTIATQLNGRLSKADLKTSASYVIDLHSPCFKGMCAQDNVIPEAYQYDPAYEGELFGCDLWVEVTGISNLPVLPTCGDGVVNQASEQCEPPNTPTCNADCQFTSTTLTVIKHVDNTGGGTHSASEFTMQVTGTNVLPSNSFPGVESPGTDVTLDAGSYSVDETTGPSGYTKGLSSDCSGSIVAGEHKTCTITNTYNQTCGDGFINGSEQCDDGNTSNTDDCLNSCLLPTCHDGFVWSGHEQCDDGDTDNTNGCVDTCELATCGDGYLHSGVEECDDSNTSSNDYCSYPACKQQGSITVNKVVTNDCNGKLEIADFTLKVDSTTVQHGVTNYVLAGAHTVSEDGVFGYVASISGACDASGNVSVLAGMGYVCNITNDDVCPYIIVKKTVVGGSAAPDDFDVSIDHIVKTSGSSNQVTANVDHVIDEEVMVDGYSFSFLGGTSFLGVSCPTALEGTINLKPGDVVTCTITNTHP